MADPQGAMLGNAHGYVDIDISGVSRNLNQARGQFQNFISQTGSMMQGWGSQISSFGQNLTLWTAPIGVAMATGLNVAADFDSVLTEIQARTGLTAEAMEQVRQTALQLGADTAFSSQQAADAFLNLLTAGLSVEESLATLPGVLDAAAAGGMDLATAADLTTSIMASFNLTAEDTTAIIDAMSRASAASPASMSEIGIAMKDVGGLAQMFNMDLDETAAVLAIFAQNGIRGAEAGTQLRSMLLNMSSPTAATQAAWEALGTSLYDAQGNMRNLDDVLADIRVGLQRLPVEQQNEVIAQLAGSYGIVGFNALLASDGIGTMQASMAEQAAASEVAAARMASFKGVVDSFMGSIEALWITVMTPFMNNVLRPVIGMATDAANTFTAWASANEPLVQTIMQIAGVFLTLGPILIGVGMAMQLVGGAMSIIGTVAAFVLSPITLLIAGVAGLAYVFRNELGAAVQVGMQWLNAMWVFLSTFLTDIRQFGLGEAILGIFGQGSLGETSQSLLEGMLFRMGFSREAAIRITNQVWMAFSHWFIRLRMLFFEARGMVAEIFERVSGAVMPAFNEISTFIQNNLGGIGQFIVQIFEIGRTLLALTNPIGQVGLVLRLFGVDVLFIFEQIMAGIQTFFNFLNAGASPMQAFAAGVTEAFNNPALYVQVMNFFNLIQGMIGSLQGWITGVALPALGSLADWFMTTAMPAVIGFITGVIVPAIQSFITTLGDIWNRVSPALMNLGNWFLVDILPQIVSIVVDSLIPLIGSIAQTFVDLWTIISPHLASLMDWFLVTGLPLIGSFISDVFLPVVQDQINWMKRLWDDVSPMLLSLADWFLNVGLPPVIDFITNDVMPIVQGLIDLLSGIWTAISPALDMMYEWFMSTGLPAIVGFLQGAATTAINGLISLLQGITGPIQSAINSMNQLLGTSSGTNTGNAGAFAGAMAGQQAMVQSTVRGAAFNVFGQFASGINYVPNDMIAMIHEGERIQRANENPYNPNAQMNGMGGGMHIENLNVTVPNARTRAEGAEVAEGFMERFEQIAIERGLR